MLEDAFESELTERDCQVAEVLRLAHEKEKSPEDIELSFRELIAFHMQEIEAMEHVFEEALSKTAVLEEAGELDSNSYGSKDLLAHQSTMIRLYHKRLDFLKALSLAGGDRERSKPAFKGYVKCSQDLRETSERDEDLYSQEFVSKKI